MGRACVHSAVQTIAGIEHRLTDLVGERRLRQVQRALQDIISSDGASLRS
jgi:hypothetical protein